MNTSALSWIKNWNGQLPQYTAGAGTPFVQLNRAGGRSK